MDKLIISEEPQTEIFKINPEYQELTNNRKLEILSTLQGWIEGQREIIRKD